jgi:hypothetical protein
VYWLTHSDFRSGLIQFGENVVGALATDITSPELPMPADAYMDIKDQISSKGYQYE